MKRAGELFSLILDEKIIKEAREYSALNSAWRDITTRNNIAQAASHSRPADLSRGVLLVEADHPGWIQLLQTKQRRLLDEVQRRFPGLNISGIAFRLEKSGSPGKGRAQAGAGQEKTAQAEAEKKEAPETRETEAEALPEEAAPPAGESPGENLAGIDSIKDEELKTMLQNLGKQVYRKKR